MSFVHILNKIPESSCVALSGGLDSMVALDFMMRGGRDVTALHFNHGTKGSLKYEDFVRDFCNQNNIKLIIGTLNEEVPPGRSVEDFWREKRYNFFNLNRDNKKVIFGHHLDDVVETWVFSSLKGQGKLIPHERDWVLRPFLLNKKDDLYRRAERYNIPFIEDESNTNVAYDRNYIRNVMMPHILRINPGIHKTLKKKLISKWRV